MSTGKYHQQGFVPQETWNLTNTALRISNLQLQHANSVIANQCSFYSSTVKLRGNKPQTQDIIHQNTKMFRRSWVEASWNVMAHAQKPDFVFRRNGRVHLKSAGALVQSTTCSRGVRISGSNAGYICSEVLWRVRSTHSIRQFPLHFPSRAITFQLDSTTSLITQKTCKHYVNILYCGKDPATVIAQG